MTTNQLTRIPFSEITPRLIFMRKVVIRQGEQVGPRCTYHQQLVIIEQGSGSSSTNGGMVALQPGDLLYFAPGTPQTIFASHTSSLEMSIIHFHFTRSADRPAFAESLYFNPDEFVPDDISEKVTFTDFSGLPSIIRFGEDYTIRRFLVEIEKEGRLQSMFYEAYMDSILLGILSYTARVAVTSVARSVYEDGSAADWILEYLHNHYREAISNQKLGELFHFHPGHINRLVQSKTGVSVHQYLIWLRLRAAYEMLCEKGMSVCEVAAAVGYEDPQYFSRLFRRKMGVPPTDVKEHRHWLSSQLTHPSLQTRSQSSFG